AGFQMVLTGVVADLISASRSILEDVSYRLRRMEDGEDPAKADPARDCTRP
ncbi:MAG: glycosyltransferase family 2 protein, partial [bacterium]|nr:glycosyltransferase family 2 protein [bacterium]